MARQSGKSRARILFYAAMQHAALHGKFAHGAARIPCPKVAAVIKTKRAMR
jgi:hypothetical protein